MTKKMDPETEIPTLAAETLALTSVLKSVLGRLWDLDNPEIKTAITEGLDHASDVISDTAVIMGMAGRGNHVMKAIEIVDQIRQVVVTDRPEPKHRV